MLRPRVLVFVLLTWMVLVASSFGLRAAGARAEGPVDGPSNLGELSAQIQALIDSWGYDVAVGVTDLQTGETGGVRSDEARPTGCTINLLVLLQTALDVQDGLLSMDDVDWMIAETIYWSDATLARELLYMLGGDDLGAGIQRVNELAQRLGLTSAVYDHPPAFGDESDEAVDNTMTPSDMNKLLSMLWRGEILSPEMTEYFLGRMTDVSPGLQYLIQRSVGENGIVSHKNGFYWGDLGYVDDDVGVVSVQREDGASYSYAVSYFAANVPDEFGDVELGQEVLRLVWGYFEGLYGSPPQ